MSAWEVLTAVCVGVAVAPLVILAVIKYLDWWERDA